MTWFMHRHGQNAPVRKTPSDYFSIAFRIKQMAPPSASFIRWPLNFWRSNKCWRCACIMRNYLRPVIQFPFEKRVGFQKTTLLALVCDKLEIKDCRRCGDFVRNYSFTIRRILCCNWCLSMVVLVFKFRRLSGKNFIIIKRTSPHIWGKLLRWIGTKEFN